MDFKAIIAITLAVSLSLTWVIIVSAIAYWHQPLTEQGAKLLELVGAGMISIISFIVGQHTK